MVTTTAASPIAHTMRHTVAPSPSSQLALSGPCRGALSFDDRDLGLNNQLASLSYMLCAARHANACSLRAAPLGYQPCGVHLPGKRTRSGCHTDSNATMEVLDLLQFNRNDTELLQRGQNLARTSPTVWNTPRCRNDAICAMCGPYMVNPYRCVRNGIDEGKPRLHVIYAYGLSYHQRSQRRPDYPFCPLIKLTLAPSVEAYARKLMTRLRLEPGRYVAAQYRTGWNWRVHTFRKRKEWSCYGKATINASLERVRALYPARTEASGKMPEALFLLTNEHNVHEPGVPVPIQVLAEMRVASLAHTVLLNPMSSFQDAIRQMRGHGERIFFVSSRDVLPNDYCSCTAADEDPKWASRRLDLCANASAFRTWITGIESGEKANIEKRRESWRVENANKPRSSTSNTG